MTTCVRAWLAELPEPDGADEAIAGSALARPTELARDGDDAAATSGAAMPAGASAELAADPPFVSASFEASPKAFHAAAMVPATLSIIIISAQ